MPVLLLVVVAVALFAANGKEGPAAELLSGSGAPSSQPKKRMRKKKPDAPASKGDEFKERMRKGREAAKKRREEEVKAKSGD